jgi:hypothetical protein
MGFLSDGGTVPDTTRTPRRAGFRVGSRFFFGPMQKNRREVQWFAMHYEAHQSVVNDLEARIVTMRDSL